MNFEPMYDGALVTCSGADRNNLTFSTNLKESLRGVDFVQAFATGQLAPLVDRVFPLAQAAEAHRYMEASGNLGKIVLTID